MSILYCARCDDAFDSDHHTEPLCRRCMSGIVTSYIFPPIPDRRFDWQAVFDDYDGAPDSGPQLIGHGRTENEAILDLTRAI